MADAEDRRFVTAQPRIPVDHAGLAEALSVLAYEARLEILELLAFPKSTAELRVAPHRIKQGDNPERPMSRQAVQIHLAKLVEAGLVHLDVREQGAGQKIHYFTANAARLYALTEDLRTLCVRYAKQIPNADATGTVAANRPRERFQGPALVLAHGVYEGREYPLKADAGQPARWVIGRRKNAHVALDYDPFVSSEHAIVTRDAGGFVVSDVKASKNGTFVNWSPIPKGGSERLRPGDVIGVGRSLLVLTGGAATS